MVVVIASFTTRPGEGSEGGVGWAFLRAAAEVSAVRQEKIVAIIDQRDAEAVETALKNDGAQAEIEVRPIKIQNALLRKYGNRRTRGTYVGWTLKARRELHHIMQEEKVSRVHQVTFATASIPPIFWGVKGVTKVWGPINIPVEPGTPRFIPKKLSAISIRLIGQFIARDADVVIATNRNTYEVLRTNQGSLYLEPNIVIGKIPNPPKEKSKSGFCLVGNLNVRKQPHLAVKMMTQPRFDKCTLKIVGDGPLRSELEKLVVSEGLQSRVQFYGRVSRDAALKQIAGSRLLIHPSSSEGAAWVIGEAASVGVPAIAFRGAGGDSTIELSNNGGELADPNYPDLAMSLGNAVEKCMQKPAPLPTTRWNADRLPKLIQEWWG